MTKQSEQQALVFGLKMNPDEEKAEALAWKSMDLEQRMDHLDKVFFNAKLDQESRSMASMRVFQRERELATDTKNRNAECHKRERLLAGQEKNAFSRSDLVEINDAICAALELGKGDPEIMRQVQAKILKMVAW